MTDLEYKIFGRALENLYGSILLGEEHALTYTEHLICLNRALRDTAHSRWPLASEVDLLRRAWAVCWPERTLEICQEEGVPMLCQVGREALFFPVCRLLFEAAEQGGFPTCLALEEKGGTVEYRLLMGTEVWRRGTVGRG